MFTYFAHAGHDHTESTDKSAEGTAITVAEVRTEQDTSAVSADHTPIIVGGIAFALGAAVLLGATYVAGNRRAAKKK